MYTEGVSSEYEITSNQAWSPFSRSRMYPIPDKILDQYNLANVATLMGLFADIRYAWVSIDNALYLWDYTLPDPPLVGFEEQPNSITAVAMVKPRPGVFISSVHRLIVVATTAEIILVGIGLNQLAGGTYQLDLYQTKMSVSVRGLNITEIGGSEDGRIFFTGTSDNDVYELTYSTEERWFTRRCEKINHTTSRLSSLGTSFIFSSRAPVEITTQIAVDDTRKLVYTLSSHSTIRIFHMKTGKTLNLAIKKTWSEILNHIGHMIAQSELLTIDTTLIGISPISSHEATRIHLLAVTNTGCRIFLSATQPFGYGGADAANAPISMQVHHIKFPPTTQPIQNSQNAPTQPHTAPAPVTNTQSKYLMHSRKAVRYPPGFFLDLISPPDTTQDQLFISAPDSGRINRPQDQFAPTRFPENAMWLQIGARAAAVGLVTESFGAAKTPIGFANELAVQFDNPITEIAILTNTGIQTIRRQRLVDTFVNVVRNGRNDEGLEGSVRRFIRLYGRTETAATALAVACGQAIDSAPDVRGVVVADQVILEHARTAFIEHGGRPHYNENALVENNANAADVVTLSPRHDGLALYISRLVRSFWRSPVVKEATTSIGGLQVLSTINADKLQSVQQELNSLQEFLNTNKNFIDGLAGPEALGRTATPQQELAMAAEHRSLRAMVKLVSNCIEGISFVQMLFTERMDEIMLSLSPESQTDVRNLTYEALFSQPKGQDVARILIRAIVNRNIQNGANVETVADALRRRCGNFCSPADVIIFKAQEQLRRAAEMGGGTEMERNLLNESLRLFSQVAADLSQEQVENAVKQYTNMSFFAGAIELCLTVAHEIDRGNLALTWIENGRPERVNNNFFFVSESVLI
jgi:nuclear pore complex protein Nup155